MINVKGLAAVAALMLLTGCGPTWSTAELETAPVASATASDERKPTEASSILITEDDITDRPYEVLSDLKVTVNKTTIFHKDPTNEMVDEELRKEAAKIGANAVILVRYGTVGISLMSWASLDGRGRAVAFTE